MGRMTKFGVGLAAAVAAGWLWWQWQFPSCTFKYRLTVEVETPEGVKSGSSVTQVSYSSSVGPPNPGRFPASSVTGEATHVDLGSGKHLFVTLTSNASGREWKDGAQNALRLPLAVLGLTWRYGDERSLCREMQAKAGTADLAVPLANLPTTVTFKDLNDPKSVELVDPRDISKAFGAGYVVRVAKLSVGPHPLLDEIERVLPWLTEFNGRAALDGSSFAGPTEPARSQLGYTSFKMVGGPQ